MRVDFFYACGNGDEENRSMSLGPDRPEQLSNSSPFLTFPLIFFQESKKKEDALYVLQYFEYHKEFPDICNQV